VCGELALAGLEPVGLANPMARATGFILVVLVVVLVVRLSRAVDHGVEHPLGLLAAEAAG